MDSEVLIDAIARWVGWVKGMRGVCAEVTLRTRR